MRYALLFSLFAVLLGITVYATRAEDRTAPPPKPLPMQVQTDNAIVETEIGTDLHSQKEIKEEESLKLLWNGADVPPLCFNALVMGEVPLQSVDLTTCGTDPELTVTKTYHRDGQLITDYRYKESEPDEPDVSIMYRVVGTTADGTAIEVSNYTGGSGRFTGLQFVKVEENTLRLVKALGGGDRCNSGVADAEVKNNTLTYGFYITPADFPMLATGSDQGLVAYEDLEASASSCFGIARYREGKLIEVELLPQAVDASDPEWTQRYGLQTCFNQQMKAQADKKAILPAEEFKTFVQHFLSSCRKA
jgi:hypothetical protein